MPHTSRHHDPAVRLLPVAITLAGVTPPQNARTLARQRLDGATAGREPATSNGIRWLLSRLIELRSPKRFKQIEKRPQFTLPLRVSGRVGLRPDRFKHFVARDPDPRVS